MSGEEGAAVIECLLFVASAPVPAAALARATGLAEAEVEEILAGLGGGYRGLQVVKLAEGYRLTTRPEYAAQVEAFSGRRLLPLSQAALETLAVIAYRQPVTRAEIEAVRGVKVEGVLANLLERGLIKEMGTKPAPGNPILYGTTPYFLEYFGLESLAQLPRPEEPGEDAGGEAREG
ncbi:MAG: SMC-Scp complex subunit ScpB [Clostridia bacterium]|nr:MAG: SMC-Scp complex subunit ScpB [Clostridia bacterium]